MNVINLGIMAHVDAGKTTVTEGMLYHSGAIHSFGRVDEGTTKTDSMEIEKKRGMTVCSATVSFEWENTKINLIDTPGHMDFVAEVERSLSVVDGVVLVISAKEGVQPQTRVIFNKLKELKIPTIFFLNKIDRIGVKVEEVLLQIKQQLTDDIIPLQKVEGAGTKEIILSNPDELQKEIRDGILLHSEYLLERYLADEEIAYDEYKEEFLNQVRQNQNYPLLMGAALSDVGIDELLSAITACFQGLKNTLENTGFTAYVYKLERDARNHKKLYFRVLSGAVIMRKKYSIFGREGRNEHFVVGSLWGLEKGKSLSVDYVAFGDIGVLVDVEGLRCGDYFVVEGANMEAQVSGLSYELAKPLMNVSVVPVLPEKRHELLIALTELTEEDPFLELRIHKDTGEISIQLFGELQMEVITTLLKDRYHIEVEFGTLSTTLKEHPISTGVGSISFRDPAFMLYAAATVSIEPLPLGSGMEYINQVSYGYLEKPFQNAVYEGILKGLQEGLQGHEVIDVRVIFENAVYDSVMGTPSDFRKLMPHVIRRALEAAEVTLLEPWLDYEITIPLGFEKRLISDLTKMRATFHQMEYGAAEMVVRGIIPLDTSKNYGTELHTYTEGKGVFKTDFYMFM